MGDDSDMLDVLGSVSKSPPKRPRMGGIVDHMTALSTLEYDNNNKS